MDRDLLPERGHGNKWASCAAAALDGCVYFMPSDLRRSIMKLDPKNNDEISSVGDDLGGNRRKYIGTASALTDVCTGCLIIPSASSNMTQIMA